MCTKFQIRKEIKSSLKMMSDSIRRAESHRIWSRLEENVYFRQAKTVMMFYSLPDEVSTHEFIRKWSKEKVILLPVVKGKDMEVRVFVSEHEMKISDFHIEVPEGAPFCELSQIDLIIVPGVAFTGKGLRLGRGGGYYDRFLARPALRQVHKIGVCYACQLREDLPVESFDISMDEVLTSI